MFNLKKIKYIYLMNKQFDKLMKNQSERIKKFYDSVKANEKIVFGGSDRYVGPDQCVGPVQV